MTGKVAVFVDGGYLDHLRDHRRVGRLDLEKLVHSAVGDGELLRAYYYTCMPFQGEPPTEEERGRYAKKDQFLSVVRRLPRFEVRLGKIQRIGDDVRQKRVDILLAIELVSLAWKGSIDLAVVIAGDSDFVPAVEQAKDAGVVVRLLYFRESCHDELLDAVDERVEITQVLVDFCQRDE
ncbi:NYN domain-containing protein [Methanocorpusculum sp. MG]|uniref:NYN domain-containing protein n=1 Tax=Methanocorpusculum petauri TaxID=3002863 RepID=A0ABT4IG91_9EURY|nr:NYN domain-containing protein [Methanocorpusculum petauri]MCZ0860753.1 NYN domain-containing protein [Methanocorpusculum petauri]